MKLIRPRDVNRNMHIRNILSGILHLFKYLCPAPCDRTDNVDLPREDGILITLAETLIHHKRAIRLLWRTSVYRLVTLASPTSKIGDAKRWSGMVTLIEPSSRFLDHWGQELSTNTSGIVRSARRPATILISKLDNVLAITYVSRVKGYTVVCARWLSVARPVVLEAWNSTFGNIDAYWSFEFERWNIVFISYFWPTDLWN